MDVLKFGVIGAGQMGSGIAQVAAAAGLQVVLQDIEQSYCERGMATIANSLAKMVNKEKISETEKNATLQRITSTTSLQELATVDYVVEAAVENEKLKLQIFEDLDRLCPPQTILASNTSSIPIGRIAAGTSRPDKVIGMHFMNPVPVMKLVEVIRGIATSQETFDCTWQLCEKFGKIAAEANDYPGFISNRILIPMINEAIYCLYHGVGKVNDIDTVMRLGMNHPMGPLALADLIGLDTCLSIMETLHDGFRDSKYRPCPLLRKYVEAGWLGRKSGKGFYEY